MQGFASSSNGAWCPVSGLRPLLFDGLHFHLYYDLLNMHHLCFPFTRVDERKSQQPQNPLQVRNFSSEHHALSLCNNMSLIVMHRAMGAATSSAR